MRLINHKTSLLTKKDKSSIYRLKSTLLIGPVLPDEFDLSSLTSLVSERMKIFIRHI